MVTYKHTLIMAVKEMLDRNWDVYEIASKLCVDLQTVQGIIDMLKGLV
jgi:hypothetical protein